MICQSSEPTAGGRLCHSSRGLRLWDPGHGRACQQHTSIQDSIIMSSSTPYNFIHYNNHLRCSKYISYSMMVEIKSRVKCQGLFWCSFRINITLCLLRRNILGSLCWKYFVVIINVTVLFPQRQLKTGLSSHSILFNINPEYKG